MPLSCPCSSATCKAGPPTLLPGASSASGQVPFQPNPSSFGVGCKPCSSCGNPPQIPPGQFLLGRAPPQPHSVHPLTPLGKGCPPAAPPPPALCPGQPARPSLAPQRFGERTVSTWSAHPRAAAANAGLGCRLRCTPAPGAPHRPWALPVPPASLLPAPRYQHRTIHLMLMAAPVPANPLHAAGPGTYQKLGSPQGGELNG